MADKIKFALALLLLGAGVAGFYLLAEQAMILRVLSVLAGVGLFVRGGLADRAGSRFFVFAKEKLWPKRKRSSGLRARKPCRRRAGVRLRGRHGVFLWLTTRASSGSVRPGSGLEKIMSKRWYVVHAYSGFEKSVQRALIERIARVRACRTSFGRFWCRSKRSSS
jgi:hypothetical protein